MQLQCTALLLALCHLLRGTALFVNTQADAPEDKQILVSSAPDWARQLDWNLSLPISSWQGMTWDNTTDTYELLVIDAPLFGSLPSDWSLLSKMVLLQLSGGSITGTLPESWSNMTQLISCNLSSNLLTGRLPDSWSTLPQLAAIDLSSNLLTGSLPDSWGAMPQGTLFAVSNNLLTGSLADSWNALAQGWYLMAANNKLHGTLPTNWSSSRMIMARLLAACKKFHKLQQKNSTVLQLFQVNGNMLDVSHNSLSGTLPITWSNLSNADDAGVYLDLGYNNLDGTLPSAWETLQKLEVLDLSYNSLTGTLPSTWRRLTEGSAENVGLSYLNLEGNAIHGCLPSTWGVVEANDTSCAVYAEHTLELYVQGKLMPYCDCHVSNAVYLGCLLADNVSQKLSDLLQVQTSLIYLNLHDNSLTGTLPAWLGSAPNLEYINLANNGFTGSVPFFLSNVTQVLYASLADNQLTGTIPMLPSGARLLNMSSNMLTQPTFANLPASLELLYLADNRLTGHMSTAEELPAGLVLLDLASNYMSGTLPSALPANLSILNISANRLTGPLPSSWGAASKLFEIRLDNNPLRGTLPSSWAGWGQRTGNSLQLSIVNTSLYGHMPHEWVQQFCLSINQSTNPVTLFTPLTIEVKGNLTVTAGPQVELAAQQASINVTLGHRNFNFGYGDPYAICGIPDATQNAAVMWGMFIALLLGTVLCTYVWVRRKHVIKTNRLSLLYIHIKAVLLNKMHFLPKQLADRVCFFVFDVIYSLYSQVTDIITIQQVFLSSQRRYAYLLLGVLLLPFIFLQVLVCRLSIRLCQGAINGSHAHNFVACLVGLLVSPLVFVVLLVVMLIHGVGVPLPGWFQQLKVDLFAAYRAQSLAEAFLNALPQSILQTKLYLMGNDPDGVHVYINTSLFLYSIVGSFLSILKSVVYVSVEHHKSNCSFVTYFLKLLKLEYDPLGVVCNVSTRHVK